MLVQDLNSRELHCSPPERVQGKKKKKEEELLDGSGRTQRFFDWL